MNKTEKKVLAKYDKIAEEAYNSITKHNVNMHELGIILGFMNEEFQRTIAKKKFEKMMEEVNNAYKSKFDGMYE